MAAFQPLARAPIVGTRQRRLDQIPRAGSCRFERYAHVQQRVIRAPDIWRLPSAKEPGGGPPGDALNPAVDLIRPRQIDSHPGRDLPPTSPSGRSMSDGPLIGEFGKHCTGVGRAHHCLLNRLPQARQGLGESQSQALAFLRLASSA